MKELESNSTQVDMIITSPPYNIGKNYGTCYDDNIPGNDYLNLIDEFAQKLRKILKPAYRHAYRKEFYTIKKPRTEHINTIKMNGDRNNNRMERLNNEVRSREKTMRGLKKKDTPIIDGYKFIIITLENICH